MSNDIDADAKGRPLPGGKTAHERLLEGDFGPRRAPAAPGGGSAYDGSRRDAEATIAGRRKAKPRRKARGTDRVGRRRPGI
ncbi:MAG: hypothetical protein NUW21_13030 [Elusimicrobia bacterium]|nr:hypothetical protein [Elusimicrobiota bacterium]